jgi:hypothetical protein
MRRTRAILVGLVATAGLLVSGTIAGAASPWEEADVVGQGMGGPIVAPGGARILRTADDGHGQADEDGDSDAV